MLKKTGTTNQVKCEETTRVGNLIYAEGVYNSHNFNDKLPMRKEFFLECRNYSFIANDLTTVLRMWADSEKEEVISLNILG